MTCAGGRLTHVWLGGHLGQLRVPVPPLELLPDPPAQLTIQSKVLFVALLVHTTFFSVK